MIPRCTVLVALLVAACGGREPGSCDGPCPVSKIRHLVILMQENHTFDNYFGRYCTAPTGSAPACTDGPNCCEAGPDRDPSGAAPVILDDESNAAYDPNHTRACEVAETNGGLMDRYVIGTPCSNPRNFAYADPAVIAPYTDMAAAGAIADRYFQPLAGQSAANDMYYVRAQWVFNDNEFRPDAVGKECSIIPTGATFVGPTVGDLLDDAGVSWAFYIEGYQATKDAVKATGLCPRAPTDCPFGLGIYPCVYDPSDIPIAYYENHRDNPRVMRDYAKLAADLDDETLPQVVFVRGLGYHTEHPGVYDTITDGTKFVQRVVTAIDGSSYAADTLVLVTWDEGGGYFDHVAPPGLGSDNQPYGTRLPLIAVGPFARVNAVSHVVMEHSSIAKFIEWNWLATQTGQLAGRDVTIANLGSLLDPAATVEAVPE